MFSVNEDVDIVDTFRNFTDLAHEFNFEVSTDVNPMLFERLGAAYDDLSIFKR